MSTTPQTISDGIHGIAQAANADDVGEHPPVVNTTQTASGWDAYDVWRRFIKEARERREANKVPQK